MIDSGNGEIRDCINCDAPENWLQQISELEAKVKSLERDKHYLSIGGVSAGEAHDIHLRHVAELESKLLAKDQAIKMAVSALDTAIPLIQELDKGIHGIVPVSAKIDLMQKILESLKLEVRNEHTVRRTVD